MMADSLRDVMGSPNFFDFQIPVNVSTTIAKPIKNKIPVIGKKKLISLLIVVRMIFELMIIEWLTVVSLEY